MANKEFIAKNGLIAKDTIVVSNTTATFVSANSTKANINVATDVVSVNTGAVIATTINATSTFFGNTTANVFANSTLIKVANSAGSANINPTGFVAGIVTANLTHVAVGSNVILSSADVQIGNSTANTFANSTLIKVANSAGSANLTPSQLIIGISSINATHHSTGANVLISSADISIGNTTANVFANSTLIKVANSAGSANLNPVGLTIGTSVVNTTTIASGANVLITSSSIVVGNSTVNSAFTATSIKRNNVEAAYSNVYILGSGLANVTANIASNVTISVPSAAVSDIRSSGNDYAISVDNLWNSLAFVSLTDAATIAWDMSTGINFIVTIAGNRTLGAPTNTKVGQSGYLIVRQDATGGRTLAYNIAYFFKDGGAVPTLGTGALVYNAFSYFVFTSSLIILSPAMNLA
jgi:hypothetical protein